MKENLNVENLAVGVEYPSIIGKLVAGTLRYGYSNLVITLPFHRSITKTCNRPLFRSSADCEIDPVSVSKKGEGLPSFIYHRRVGSLRRRILRPACSFYRSVRNVEGRDQQCA